MPEEKFTAAHADAEAEGGTGDGQLTVQQMKISDLHPFEGHPFKVLDDEAMMQTVESIKAIGIVSPLVARTDPYGGYELLSGHRRLRAAQLAGLENVPVIIREMDDDAAIIFLVDSNLQREGLLPSEKAYAYRMKLEAMKHQGKRVDLTSAQVGRKSDGKEARELLAEQVGSSRNQISRYIRLTYLIADLMDMVDDRKVAFNPAVELSYLTVKQQKQFLEAMEFTQTPPSLSQAQRIRRLCQDNVCSLMEMCKILNEEKKSELDHVTIKNDVLRKYFPKSYTPKQMQDTIINLLEQWQKKKQHNQEL